VHKEIAKNRSHTDADGDDSVGMVMNRVAGRPGACDRLVASAATAFLAATQCGGQTVAGVLDVFSGGISGGGYQGTRIIEQCA
jgi:hypothetical protein